MVPLCSPQVLSPPLANFQERLKIEKHFPKPCKCLQQGPGVPHRTERPTTAASCLRVFCFEFGAGEECAEGLWLPQGHSGSGSPSGATGSPSPSLPTQAPQTRIPGGPATPRRPEAACGAWPCRPATCSSGTVTAHPSITPFSPRAKGLNFNCSTKGYFSGLQVPVQCEYAERSQECKCMDAVPRRPCAPALCRIPSGFHFAEATALFCVTREHVGE